MIKADGTLSGITSSVWKRMKIGGGGFVSGGDISVDALRKIHWTDVGGLFIKDSTDPEWRPMLTAATLPQADYDPIPDNYGSGLADGRGGYGGAIAPSNKDIIAAGFNAYIYRSDDGGDSFERMALPAKKMLANTGSQRLWNDKIAIHPTDPHTWIVGTSGAGAWFTTNANVAGGTWTEITSCPAGTTSGGAPTPILVAFDPGDPTEVFLGRHGTGVYRSTTGLGAASFAHVTGGPTKPCNMMVDSAGTLWVVDYSGAVNNLWKLARGSSTWVQCNCPYEAFAVAVDPDDLNSVVALGGSGARMRSLDAGATWLTSWDSAAHFDTDAVDVPWLRTPIATATFPSKAIFDPVASNKMWLFHGIGVSWSNPPATFVTPWQDYDESAGNDELGFVCSLSIPGNDRMMFGCWDKGIWRPKDLDVYSGAPIFPDGVQSVDHCHAIDYWGDFVAAIVNYNNPKSGYSLDGGETWQEFAAQHPDGNMFGGSLAVTGPGKMIWLPGNNQLGVRSDDYGASWDPLLIGGVQLGGWQNAAYVRRFQIASDKEREGHAVMVTKNHAEQDVTKTGVWKTEDNGATSTKVLTGQIDSSGSSDTSQYWHCKIDYIPGRAGELLYTDGMDFISRLMYSDDDAVSWTALLSAEVTHVIRFGFGKGLPGSDWPAVVFYGVVNGVLGIYVSFDFFATTPVLLTRFPADLIFLPDVINGDMNIIGRFYVSMGGMGLTYCDIPDLAQT